MPAALRIALIGPTPPPFAGMPAQVLRWAENLRREGFDVTLVSTRTDLRGQPVRRSLAFLTSLLSAVMRSDVVNVHTGSDRSFHAFATPSVLFGRLFGCRVLVTYKGGAAARFLARSRAAVRVLRSADALLVPSGYLADVFQAHGLDSRVVPNILDAEAPCAFRGFDPGQGPRLIVTRNLFPLYQVDLAVRAHKQVRREHPKARLDVYGDGPELGRLQAIVRQEGIGGVTFHGNVPPVEIVQALCGADVFLNPSTVDNTPNSVVEALHAGVPVVSTDVGGIPYLIRHGESGLLVPPGDATAMAEAVLGLLRDPGLAARLVGEGRLVTRNFLWPEVFARFRSVLLGESA